MIKEIIKEVIKDGLTGETKVSNSLDTHMVGKVCMFRTYSAGVHFGRLTKKEGQTCLVLNAKRVYYWTEACSLSQLAKEGSKDAKNCKISVAVDEIILEQVIEIIPMSDAAVENLSEYTWKK